MGLKIGVDFGTTNSVISYFKNEDLREFENRCDDGRFFTPTILLYQEDDILIGRNAADEATPKDELYQFFKLYLDQKNQEDWKNSKTPLQVTKDFLTQMLKDQESDCSFERAIGPIDSLVLTVPAFWDESEDNIGLASLQEIIRGMGINNVRLLSEPQAAAAYYLWWHHQEKKEKFAGNLLVCDMGGGTFDVSLVEASEYAVKVLFNTGEGKNKGSAGLSFDRAVCNALVSEDTGNTLENMGRDGLKLLRLFERKKISAFSNKKGSIKKFIKSVETGAKDGYEDLLFTINYKGDFYFDVKGKHLLNAFDQEVKPYIKKVLDKLNNYLNRNEQTFDKLIIVGGFGQFFLVEKAILDYFNMDKQDSRYEAFGGQNEQHFSIARGAALVAKEKVSVQERIKFDVGLYATYYDDESTQAERRKFPMIERGTVYDKSHTHYLKEHIATIDYKDIPFDFFFLHENGEEVPKSRKKRVDLLKPGVDYVMGMVINESKVLQVVFEEKNQPSERITVSFADLLSDNKTLVIVKE